MHERSLLQISGADRMTFLQALVTNDITKASAEQLVYAALLSPQGKFLADFFVLQWEDQLIIDVKATHAAALAQRLGMYRLRADVQIAESDIGVRTVDASEAIGLADPRHPDLPRRIYGESGPCPDPVAIRVRHIIPETGIELTDNSYILECDFERLSGVDFKKGCYIGQEVTARMKHKATLRKGLAQLEISGSVPAGTPLTADGKPAGTVFSQHDGLAIVHMRFDRAAAELRAEDAQLRPITEA